MLAEGLVLLLLCSAISAENNDGEIFSSTYKLKHLLDAEMSSVKLLQAYIAHQRQMIKNLRSGQKAQDEMIAEPGRYSQAIEHPLNAYRLVNRFVAHWKKVYSTVFNGSVAAHTRHGIHGGMHAGGGGRPRPPHDSDFHGSYKSLLRLQMTYTLSGKKMADGLILGQLSEPLDETDCYNMALTAINSLYCAEALEWTRLAADKATSEHERWLIHSDLDDLEQRVASQGCSVLSDVIQEYLMDAVGYETQGGGEEEEEEEEIVYQDEHGRILSPSEVQQAQASQPQASHDADSGDGDDDLDVSEIASEDYVEGELNVAQFSDEMDEDLAAMDEFEYMRQLQAEAEQLKAQHNAADGEGVHVQDGQHDALGDALRQAQENLQARQGGAGQSQCGGGQPQVIEERTVEFSNLAEAAEGRTLKIKYHGNEVNAQQIDEIQRTYEEMLTSDGYSRKELMQRDERYNALCRGEEVMKRDLSKLICRYRSPNLPYNAWREEIVVRDPMVSIFYNFMTGSEMDELKERSHLQLTRAKAGKNYIDGRVQSTSWHPDNSSASLRRMSARVAAVTGLNAVESAEMWQVGQYGIGGHYAPHYDYSADPYSVTSEVQRVLGDRIATWMVYLSDVAAGGFTVFPQLGAWVRPVRGAALFWHNYNRAGEQDPRTQHAACPLLMGHKWVANKWIHQRGNELLRPCGRTRAVSEAHVHGI